MLVDAQGNQIGPIPKADRWRLFEALLRDAALATPLSDAVNAYIDSSIASHPPGQDLCVDSTAAGPHVFGRLPPRWLDDYEHWHTGACAQHHQNPEFKSITSERMYGMMLWYVLAADRPERWTVLPQAKGETRVYKLLAPGPRDAAVLTDRQVLLELREALRRQLAKLDAHLGDV